jgi:inorganic phosphate transporter, PiT family
LVSTNQEEIVHKEEVSIEDEKKILKAYTSERTTLEAKADKTKEDYERIVDLYKMIDIEEQMIKSSKKHIKKVEKVKYVKRDAVKKIIAAWIITVPAAGLLSAAIFFMIKGIVL